MKRNGDVVELSSYNSAFIRNSCSIPKYKMCKDDIVTPLFCSASDCLGKSIIMGSEHKRYFKSTKKLSKFSSRRSYVSSNMPVVENSTDSIQDSCDSPVFDDPLMLQDFTPSKSEKFGLQDSFINGSKLQISEKNDKVCDDKSVFKMEDFHGAEINSRDSIEEKLLLDYEAETSSSSIDDLYSSLDKKCEESDSNNLIDAFETDSNHNIKNLADQNVNKNPLPFSIFPPSPCFPKLAEDSPSKKSNSGSPNKNDRIMPELLPTLICLDDEDSVNSEIKKVQHEVIDVADSPEMPTLIPFTSEVDEVFKIKTECISDDDEELPKNDKAQSNSSSGETCQPHVILQKLSVNNSPNLPQEKASNNLSVSDNNRDRKSFYDGPEIEEIEGVRFFQFRSKTEMEEFNRRTLKIEADEDMILPTKTNDITQIKGWRTKYFAPESQFHNQSLTVDCTITEDSNQGSKVSADHVDEPQNENDKKENCTEDSESKKSVTVSKLDKKELDKEKDECDDSSSESEEDEKRIRLKAITEDGSKNSLSAFISEELDKYLLNSSTLNVSFLQKVNPNIIPIAPDAPILSLGKLRKMDKPFPPPILIFKRRREFLDIELIEKDSVPMKEENKPSLIYDVSPDESPKVITLDSSDESEEDVPVAMLKSKRKIRVRKSTAKGVKRSLDNDLEQAAKRVVLRLTKEGDGIANGYKVSNISCKKEKADSPKSGSLPSAPVYNSSQNGVIVPPDGSLPVIKKTLYSDKKEPNLVNEFLNNLNMYGTRKDVAMLVQSNQSYFDEGPKLTAEICAKAVNVLVSNKTYLDVKQKSKKKLKTWQKYLPKNINNQNMKMKFKRKSRIQKLLDDAKCMIPADKEKRSIRLPARYLDSAVLAASEWVSPVITIDDSNTCNKSKRQSIEVSDKSKLNNENEKAVSSSSSSQSESSSSNDSSSESSSEETVTKIEAITKIAASPKRPASVKKTPVNRKKNEVPVNKRFSKPQVDTSLSIKNQSISSPVCNIDLISSNSSDEDTVGKSLISKVAKNKENNLKVVPVKRKTSKDTPVKQSPKESSKKAVATTSQSTLTQNKKSENTAPRKRKNVNINQKYPFPDCCKHHSSRTTPFNYGSGIFVCNKISSDPKESSHIATVDINRTIKVESDSDEVDQNNSVSKNDSAVKVDSQVSVKEFNAANTNSAVKADSQVSVKEFNAANTNSVLKSEISLSLSNHNRTNCPDVSMAVPKVFPSNTNNSIDPLLKKSLSENLSTTSSTSTKNNKIFLLFQPVKTAGNSSNNVHLPPVPLKPDMQLNKTPVTSKKSKPPILIRKTSTGLVNTKTINSNESLNCNFADNSQHIQPPGITVTQHINNLPASRKLPTAVESVLLSSRTAQSASGVTLDDKTKTVQGISFINNAPSAVTNSSNSPQLVTAFKVGDNVYFYNHPMQTTNSNPIVTSNNTVAPTINQTIHDDLPIIASVQSVKQSESTSSILGNALGETEIPESTPEKLEAVLNDHDNYSKKKQNRRKSPLAPMNYKYKSGTVKTNENSEEDVDVDVEAVEDSCSETVKTKSFESDSDVSDDECANIFISSADDLANKYALNKTALKEKHRRLLIKSEFENLKNSSKWFRNAKSCLEILGMAHTLVGAHRKREQMFLLAKKRLKVHNSMLMGKLIRLLEGIDSPELKDKTKMQVIKNLALDQGKHNFNKKTALPLLSDLCKGTALSKSNAERNKSNPDATDIEFRNEKSQVSHRSPSPLPAIVNVKGSEKSMSDDQSVQEESCDAVRIVNANGAADKSVPADDSSSNYPKEEDSNNSSKRKFDEMEQKDSLEKEDEKAKEQSSDSDTEELGSDGFNMSGISDDDFDLKINSSDKTEEPSPKKLKSDNLATTKSPSVDGTTKSPDKGSYPGIIPLFHPKVMKENLSSPLLSVNSGESSQNASSSRQNINTLEDDDDDDIAIISATPPSEDSELAKATETANKLFGPCSVKKVQLKNGKHVFTYKPVSPTKAAPSAQTIASIANPGPSSSVLEEIVLSDSDDETDKSTVSATRTLSESPCRNFDKSDAQKEKTSGGRMQIGESDLQRTSNGSSNRKFNKPGARREKTSLDKTQTSESDQSECRKTGVSNSKKDRSSL